MRSTRSGLLTMLVVVLLTATLAGCVSRGSGMTYYVDATAGADGNLGSSPARAWRTLSRVNAAPLQPGDRVLFHKGHRWTGSLVVSRNGTSAEPITVGAYGEGNRPEITGASTCVTLNSSHVVLTGFNVHGCSWSGVTVSGSSNRVDTNAISDTAAGIYIRTSATDTKVFRNSLVNNRRMSVLDTSPGNDSGAFAILLHGSRTEVANNLISGSDAFSYDYGRDGAAIEIFGGRDNVIRHNTAIDNDTFAELGEPEAANNTFTYNVVRSSLDTSTFLVTRGGDGSRGPVAHTSVYSNTVSLTGASSQGVICHQGCTRDILRMRNNIVSAKLKALYTDGPVDEDYNLFEGAVQNLTIGSHSLAAAPRFVGATDLQLRADSPAVDAGMNLAAPFGDHNGEAVPRDGDGDGQASPDMGALELQAGGGGNPTTSTTTRPSATTSPTTSPTTRPTTTTSPTTTRPPTTTTPPPAGGPVTASAETAPVPHGGDAADDPAIWVHPTDPSQSLVIGTDKLGGLAVYDLSGRQLHYYADSSPNNVDVRYGFRLGSAKVDVVVTSDTDTDTMRIYTVDPATRGLRYVAARGIPTGGGSPGVCMYRATSGRYFVFFAYNNGNVRQWELFDAGAGKIDARDVRSFALASGTEGCVVDDAAGAFYVSEEDRGIWRYGADPAAGTARTQVDTVGPHLTADIEGLGIYRGTNGTGYLVASSQGNDTFAIYGRAAPNRFIARFGIVPGARDGVDHTDGVDVSAFGLGPAYSGGLFVAQDNTNEGGQNFKLVPWAVIARSFSPALVAFAPENPRAGT